MHRRDLFRGTALLGAGFAFRNSADTNQLDLPPDTRERINKAAAAGLAMERRDWEQGTLAQAFLEAGQIDQVLRLTKAAIVLRAPDGRLAVVVEGGPTDPAMGGAAYWHAAQITHDPEIQQAVDGLLEWILHKAPRAPDGTLYHVFDHLQVWSDGFNGAPPFLAATGHCEEALRQIEGFRKRLWDPQKKLLAHIWDDSPNAKNTKEFWGGGNGWAAAGLARVIRSLNPDRQDDRRSLAAFAKDIIDGCLAYQRPDGLFHDVIDQPDTFVETNLAQMLAFAIYTGICDQWLPAQYRAHADRMRDATRNKMDRYGYVQGACGAPNFDRPGTSTEAQAFAMMMEAAAARTRSS
jgi:unsaturated rhamnogalacturonyl hydrolase